MAEGTQDGIKMTTGQKFDITISGADGTNYDFKNMCTSFSSPTQNNTFERIRTGGQQDDFGQGMTTARQVAGSISFECIYDSDKSAAMITQFQTAKKIGMEGTVDITVQGKDPNGNLTYTYSFSKVHITDISSPSGSASDASVQTFTVSAECETFTFIK